MTPNSPKTQGDFRRALADLQHAYMGHGNQQHRGSVAPAACSTCARFVSDINVVKAEAKRRGHTLR